MNTIIFPSILGLPPSPLGGLIQNGHTAPSQASEPSQINHLILVSDWRHQGQSQDEPRRGQESRWREVTSNAIALQSGEGGVGRMANTSTAPFTLPFTHTHTNPRVPLTTEYIC